jgi:hypothetical protein
LLPLVECPSTNTDHATSNVCIVFQNSPILHELVVSIEDIG